MSGTPSVVQREASGGSSGSPTTSLDQAGADQAVPQFGNADQEGGSQAAVPNQAGSSNPAGGSIASLSQGGVQVLSLGQGNGSDGGFGQSVAAPGSPDEGDPTPTARQAAAQGGSPRHVGVEPPSLVGRDPSDVTNHGSVPPSRAGDLLAESLPIDFRALDEAIDHCLDRIESMGDALSDLLATEGAWPWLAGTAIVAAASSTAHAWVRRSRPDPLALSDGDGSMSSWFLEPISDG